MKTSKKGNEYSIEHKLDNKEVTDYLIEKENLPTPAGVDVVYAQVYFDQEGNPTNQYKIGKSSTGLRSDMQNNLIRRKSDLCTSWPGKTKYVFIYPISNALYVEKQIHEYLKLYGYHIDKEIFEIHDINILISIMNDLTEKFGIKYEENPQPNYPDRTLTPKTTSSNSIKKTNNIDFKDLVKKSIIEENEKAYRNLIKLPIVKETINIDEILYELSGSYSWPTFNKKANIILDN